MSTFYSDLLTEAHQIESELNVLTEDSISLDQCTALYRKVQRYITETKEKTQERIREELSRQNFINDIDPTSILVAKILGEFRRIESLLSENLKEQSNKSKEIKENHFNFFKTTENYSVLSINLPAHLRVNLSFHLKALREIFSQHTWSVHNDNSSFSGPSLLTSPIA